MLFGLGNTTTSPETFQKQGKPSEESVPSFKKAQEKSRDGTRRVIFPSLHGRLSCIRESREDRSNAGNDLSRSVPRQQLRGPLTLKSQLAKDDFELNITRNGHGSLSNPQLEPLSVAGGKCDPLDSKPNSTSKNMALDNKSLMIPDFHGKSLTLFQQDHTDAAGINIPQQFLTLPKDTITLPLRSILRRKQPKASLNIEVSDSLPSLVSFGTKDESEEDDEDDSEVDEIDCNVQNSEVGKDGNAFRLKSPSSSDGGKSVSFDVPSSTEESTTKSVSFDPRIWVCEFARSKEEADNTWFSIDELNNFKKDVVKTIYENSPYELVATGTGRVVRRPIKTKAVYTNPALSLDATSDEEDDGLEGQDGINGGIPSVQKVLKLEIKNILVVDPYDICCRLFEKAIHKIIPHAHVASAKSGKEAMKKVTESKNGYDLVIVEERLTLFHRHYSSNGSLPNKDQTLLSGSTLLKILSGSSKNRLLLSDTSSKPLLIGVSSHLDEDKDKLQRGGADLLWSKPPPMMTVELRNLILKALLLKRGKEQIASKLKW